MKMPPFKAFRSFTLFVGGLAGVGYETIVEHTDRPTLLVVFTAMMGLPLFLGADEKAQLKIVKVAKEAAQSDADAAEKPADEE